MAEDEEDEVYEDYEWIADFMEPGASAAVGTDLSLEPSEQAEEPSELSPPFEPPSLPSDPRLLWEQPREIPAISTQLRVRAHAHKQPQANTSPQQQLAGQGFAPVPELYQGTWANVGPPPKSHSFPLQIDIPSSIPWIPNDKGAQVNQGLVGSYRDILTTYWQQTINHLETSEHDYKLHQLPLARIKKVMKADPDVKMISAEAPILFAKGCDIFITELTMRAWIHAEENKRRTLQRSDIASALARSDMFDFLIDIVPREEAAAKRTGGPGGGTTPAQGGGGGGQGGMMPPQPQPVQQSGGGQQGGHMGGHEYGMPPQAVAQEQEYVGRAPGPPQGIYTGQEAPQVYGQPGGGQMFEGMYGYPSMGGQPVS